ncbi:unnamed protein product [Pleuronectes platessa]|uniref:Uncharacterized protein n=1 Tax=Pleuronectes platessa TaxID=8262 RepID=A0A9N7UWR4_PLEPL|nr:unnamed protein product [Pleuronectes platessa]
MGRDMKCRRCHRGPDILLFYVTCQRRWTCVKRGRENLRWLLVDGPCCFILPRIFVAVCCLCLDCDCHHPYL